MPSGVTNKKVPVGIGPLFVGFRQLNHDLRALWSDSTGSEEPDSPRPVLLLERLTVSLPILVRYTSLSNLRALLGSSNWITVNFMDLYVMLFAVMLTILLFWHPSNWIRAIAMVLAIYDIVQISTYRMYLLLVKSRRTKWSYREARRTVVFAFVNFYETVVGYALLYLLAGNVGNQTRTLASLGGVDAAVGAFYYSLVTMLTVGYGDYSPQGHLRTEVLVVTQLVTSLLFLLVIIPSTVSLVPRWKD